MSDLAGVVLSILGCEEHTSGQMEAPVLIESQVCLVGFLQLLLALHQLDADVRGVEATHVTNEDVFLPKLSWMVAVHLNLGWSYGQRRRVSELSPSIQLPSLVISTLTFNLWLTLTSSVQMFQP